MLNANVLSAPSVHMATAQALATVNSYNGYLSQLVHLNGSSTDIAPIVNAAFANSSVVTIPIGIYRCSTPINIPSGATLRGISTQGTIINLYGASTTINLQGNMSEISNIRINGLSGSPTAVTVPSGFGHKIYDIHIYSAGVGISGINGARVLLSKSNFYSCGTAILLNPGAEYWIISGCQINSSTVTGISVAAGNCNISGCNIYNNVIGISFLTSANDSHTTVTGTLINHGTTAFIADSITHGIMFSGCWFSINSSIILNSSGIIIQSCGLLSSNVTIGGGGYNLITNNMLLGSSAFVRDTPTPDFSHISNNFLNTDLTHKA